MLVTFGHDMQLVDSDVARSMTHAEARIALDCALPEHCSFSQALPALNAALDALKSLKKGARLLVLSLAETF